MFLDMYVGNPMVGENQFKKMKCERVALPVYDEVKDLLPHPIWAGHEDVLDCYWRAWELAFQNLAQPKPESGFVANYIDTAFNHCLFMWDSAFIMQFGKYGRHVFNFQRTLDNLYAKQHEDGFICREISVVDGQDRFHRHDPVSTGPNILAWTEWDYYCCYNDKERLANVYPVLLSYHLWLKSYRTWQNGTYWTSGWGCGMDNQPRTDKGAHPEFQHGHLSWFDACAQQIISAKILIEMGNILNRNEAAELKQEIEELTTFVNTQMWDDEQKFYFDVNRFGERTNVKSIGAYWALLAELVPSERIDALVAHLEDEFEFKRPHRIPTLSYSHPDYAEHGDYWKGSVWAPSNYMVLRGLEKNNYFDLAHEIALNHLEHVVSVFKETQTLWENYMPEKSAPGIPAKPNFVGWTGLSPISILIEYVLGIRTDVPNHKIYWHIHLEEEHGIEQLPFGIDGSVSLKCLARKSDEKPVIVVSANIPVEVMVYWKDEVFTVKG